MQDILVFLDTQADSRLNTEQLVAIVRRDHSSTLAVRNSLGGTSLLVQKFPQVL